ncbi:MAG: integrase core domain-containing protein [Terriglobales bacterium]
MAAELYLKLGILVSPRTVRKYWPWERDEYRRGRIVTSQHWATFVRNHATAIVACDFMVVVTAQFQFVYVFLILEIASRRILQCNVTAHPTVEWTLQQVREAMPIESTHRSLIHDRDAIFSAGFDDALTHGFGLRVLRTPPQSPKANAFCERLVGTLRRECLDFIIPVNERHLRRVLREWVRHYNSGRPHSSLGPGIPDQSGNSGVPESPGRRWAEKESRVISLPILGGLHHEYAREGKAA